MCTCGSISPGTTVRPPRSIVRTFGTLRGTVSPTEMNRPFLMVTHARNVFRPSIVWMRTVHERERFIDRGRRGRRLRGKVGATWTAAAPTAAAAAVPKNPLREISDMVANSNAERPAPSADGCG
jgi:hypothetical protein